MATDQFAPKQLAQIIEQLNPSLKGYSQKAQQLQAYQQLLPSAVGVNLATKCRVANYQNNNLLIEAQSSAVATKLNYAKMDILSAFRRAGMIDLCQVQIKTNPDVGAAMRPQAALTNNSKNASTTKAKQYQMSEKTAQSLIEVAQQAPPSLKEKLLRLAKHGEK